jgi:hypothetical protein
VAASGGQEVGSSSLPSLTIKVLVKLFRFPTVAGHRRGAALGARRGAVAPPSPDPIPIVLLPGVEYRLREWRNPNTHAVHWLLERRKSTQHGEDDD